LTGLSGQDELMGTMLNKTSSLFRPPVLFLSTLVVAVLFPLFLLHMVFARETFWDTDDQKREASCKGYYSLTTDGTRKDQFSGSKWILKDKYDHSAILDFSDYDWGIGSSLRLYHCVDIDRDGRKEAIVEYYSGGAHCCSVYYVYKEEDSALKLVESILLGNASSPIFKDIDKDGVMEILTLNDTFAYFGGLCYACSPFLPLVLCYRENIFSDCTNQFPGILDEEVKRTLARKGDIDDDWKGIALAYLALHIIKGQEAEGWKGVKEYYPQSYSWLKKHEEELRKKLSKDEFSKRKGAVPFK
jgi:hypothetical protein